MRGKAQATLDLEALILDIVDERAPVTVRGVCYPLFVGGHIPRMDVASTGRISKIMTAMREAETLDWTKIVDGSRAVERFNLSSGPEALMKDAVRCYRRDNWQEQPVIVEVWSEKATVQGVLEPVLDEFSITFRVMKGFSSFTSVRQAAEDSHEIGQHQRMVVLYVGDWDPSGLYMSEVDLPERLSRYGGQQTLKRVALTKADTRRLPHFDAATKKGDPRHRWFVERYGRQCWELDAMNPNDLRGRVRKEVAKHIDWDLWNHSEKVEQAEVESMHEFLNAWKDRLKARP